jgi:hypothetical protein
VGGRFVEQTDRLVDLIVLSSTRPQGTRIACHDQREATRSKAGHSHTAPRGDEEA